MQSSKVGKFEVWYENASEFYELKKEIFGEHGYYLDLPEGETGIETDKPRIIDAGAHIGMATLYFKTIFPHARITAYEPVPSNFEILKKNVRENQLDGVDVRNLAVAPKTSRLEIFEPAGEMAWKSGAGIIHNGWRGVQKGRGIIVEAVGIGEILSEKIDIFKLDVEGMEYEIIRNGVAGLRQVRNWLIEVHPRRGHRVEEIIKTLSQAGFEVEQRKDESRLGKGLSQVRAVLK